MKTRSTEKSAAQLLCAALVVYADSRGFNQLPFIHDLARDTLAFQNAPRLSDVKSTVLNDNKQKVTQTLLPIESHFNSAVEIGI